MPSTQAVERQNAAADEMLKAKRAKQQKEAESVPIAAFRAYNTS